MAAVGDSRWSNEPRPAMMGIQVRVEAGEKVRRGQLGARLGGGANRKLGGGETSSAQGPHFTSKPPWPVPLQTPTLYGPAQGDTQQGALNGD